MIKDPIDAVITWVDGKDPLHKKKLAACLGQLNIQTESAHPTRFNEVGEFEFCIASLLRFAPWLRKIFIVTDNQTPSFWDQIQKSDFADKFELVDHQKIFKGYEDVLPTFNSRSIFTLLWRIPELSEQYIYLDDDFILLNPLSPEDFFFDHKMMLRGRWELQQKYTITRKLKWLKSGSKIIPRAGNRRGQAFAAEKAGYKRKYFRAPHTPHPQLVSLQQKFYRNNPEEVLNNIKYKFRSEQQFVPTALTTHLALKNNKTQVVASNSTMRLKMDKISTLRLKLSLWFADKSQKKYLFGCFQSLDMASQKNKQILINWLTNRIGTLSKILE
ncbi:Stealth CR1 domain-containing protein [Alkalitalea saponilacus]|uniref:Stealth protein CR1, conserved region 1 n=1 Tax=Alkalitalea saponilacus TaxID=889453 RepID=A0A1T5EDL1_9BACT|nr:Stealth CR1 domain-containing protein [Alkalitalea saponilacus]ASB51098.1 capsular biosynthesis protein [Alkalitalea saponilacus]SKB82003.1 Stealth protein CR1, conserved region 1 [Alkalitalea saponilacus]